MEPAYILKTKYSMKSGRSTTYAKIEPIEKMKDMGLEIKDMGT